MFYSGYFVKTSVTYHVSKIDSTISQTEKILCNILCDLKEECISELLVHPPTMKNSNTLPRFKHFPEKRRMTSLP